MNIRDDVLHLMNSIKVDFGVDGYVGVSGDRQLEHITPKLRELWYSSDELSICTIDTYYIRTKDFAYPDDDIESFRAKLLDLQDALAHEFELIQKTNANQ